MRKRKPRIGILRIEPGILLKLLDFNTGRLISSRVDFSCYMVEFKIEHKDFDPVEEGAVIPWYTPAYVRACKGKGCRGIKRYK